MVPSDFGLMKPPGEGVTRVMHVYQAWTGSLRVYRIKGRAKKEQNAQKLQFLKVNATVVIDDSTYGSGTSPLSSHFLSCAYDWRSGDANESK